MRTKGAKDADYAEKKAALVSRIRSRLAERDGGHPSFRELAAKAGVGQATLRHYFGDMDGLVVAVFQEYAREGAPYLEMMAHPSGPLDRSITDAVSFMARGQRQGSLRAVHAAGRAEGVRRVKAGHAYREHILDATIDAVARRLTLHQERGELRNNVDVKAAAISLVAPVLFAFQHQADLDGSNAAPFDVEAFLAQHASSFVRAYGT